LKEQKGLDNRENNYETNNQAELSTAAIEYVEPIISSIVALLNRKSKLIDAPIVQSDSGTILECRLL